MNSGMMLLAMTLGQVFPGIPLETEVTEYSYNSDGTLGVLFEIKIPYERHPKLKYWNISFGSEAEDMVTDSWCVFDRKTSVLGGNSITLSRRLTFSGWSVTYGEVVAKRGIRNVKEFDDWSLGSTALASPTLGVRPGWIGVSFYDLMANKARKAPRSIIVLFRPNALGAIPRKQFMKKLRNWRPYLNPAKARRL